MLLLAVSDDRSQVALGRLISSLGGLERLGGDARGDLARLGSSHPICDGEHRCAGEEGVLVCGALAARVGSEGLLDDAQHHSPPGICSSKRSSVSPMRITSRSEISASPSSVAPLRTVPLVEFRSST